MTTPASSSSRRTALLAAGGAAVLVVLLVVLFVLLRGGDDPDPAGNAGDGPSTGVPGVPSASPGTDFTPGTGSTVPSKPVRTLPPVGLEQTAAFGTGVTVELTDITAVRGRARTAGEIAGPALAIDLRATNGSKKRVALDGVVVFVTYGKARTPAVALSTGTSPLQGVLAPGASAQGTYVVTVPKDQRDRVRVEVSYSGKAPTVAFAGAVG